MVHPGVAKFGIALEWGSRGLEFESQHSDHKSSEICGFRNFFCFGRLPNKRKTMHDAAIAVVKKRAYNRRAVVSSKNIAVPSYTARHLLNILLMLRVERLGHYSIKRPVEPPGVLHRSLCIKTMSREMTEKNGEISEGR